MNWLASGTALLLGVVLTSQVATNKQLGQHLHNLYIPAVVNMVIGIVATLAITFAMSKEWPSPQMVRAAPWYLWLAGGVFGAIYLTGTILLAPTLGAAALIALVVTGQLVFSVLVDQLGFEIHAANWPRLVGCTLLVAGAALVSRF